MAAALTRAVKSLATPRSPRNARDTVMGLTLANAATSASVTRPVARERVFFDVI
jgi:hypothetical protein